jgi:hypothetical protein
MVKLKKSIEYLYHHYWCKEANTKWKMICCINNLFFQIKLEYLPKVKIYFKIEPKMELLATFIGLVG